MQRLESPQNASSESFSRSSNLTEQASTLLSERHSTQTGGRRELAATSIDLASNVYGSVEKAGSCTRADDACSWRPDDSSGSAQTRTWRSQREAQRDKPLDTQDGKYEIKPGDTMNDISKRYLKELGIENPSGKEVAGLSKMLADQNKEQYSILKCNPNLIRPGMKLELPPTDTIQRLWPKQEANGSWQDPELDLPDSRLAVPQRPGLEDGTANLPELFNAPNGLMELETNWFKDAIQLPFNMQKDAPGQIMNLPFRPSEDAPGKVMTLENRIANSTSRNGANDSQSFLKRMLDHVPLPEVMLV